MAKTKRNCEKCSNRTGTWCSMQKDMIKGKKKMWEGFKIIPPKKKVIIVKKETIKREELPDDLKNTKFGAFLKNGGMWSFRK